jgi:hypothetical protein
MISSGRQSLSSLTRLVFLSPSLTLNYVHAISLSLSLHGPLILSNACSDHLIAMHITCSYFLLFSVMVSICKQKTSEQRIIFFNNDAYLNLYAVDCSL